MSVGNRVLKSAPLAAVPVALLLLAGCAGQGAGSASNAAYEQACRSQGYAPDERGWNNCISRQRSQEAAERLPHDSIRWGI
ncbi:hypothetical protein ACFOGJ_01365 [Marinibaculum pumilum]|uniref:Lipoprotein n=1 Tax=Marinibaculum pumilum TaxID=1766165 RepID=A0ABV7KU81_9PROT